MMEQRYVEIAPGVRVDMTPIDQLKPGDWILRTGEASGIQVSEDGKSLKFRLPPTFVVNQ